jgi:hypothetical protein
MYVQHVAYEYITILQTDLDASSAWARTLHFSMFIEKFCKLNNEDSGFTERFCFVNMMLPVVIGIIVNSHTSRAA